MAKFLAVLLVAVALWASSAHALKCYSCAWSDDNGRVNGDPQCAEKGTMLMEVPADANAKLYCFKLSGTRNGKLSLVNRAGGTKEKLTQTLQSQGIPSVFTVPTDGCSQFGFGTDQGTLCSCSTDMCNGSKKTGAVVSVVVLTTLFSAFLKQFIL